MLKIIIGSKSWTMLHDRNSDRNFWKIQNKRIPFAILSFRKRISSRILSDYQLEKSSRKVVRKKINSCEMVTQHCVFVLIEFWSTWTATTEQQHQLNKPLIWPLLALWQIALDNCFPTRGWKSWRERTTNDENPPLAPQNLQCLPHWSNMKNLIQKLPYLTLTYLT